MTRARQLGGICPTIGSVRNGMITRGAEVVQDAEGAAGV
jgi:hypothetical protein